jgi:hypothetical protein
MYNNINNKEGKEIKEFKKFKKSSINEENNILFTIKFNDNEICNICADNTKLLTSENYRLNDLNGKIFIEFGECKKPEDVNFHNDNLKNISYHYFYIEYKYPDLEDYFYYCFCLASQIDSFEGLYIIDYIDPIC